jgi:hypothetical protein
MFRETVQKVQKVAVFFGESAKRMKFLENAIHETHEETRRLRLKKHCHTRWVEQADALVIFTELYDSVLQALELITKSCDGNTSSSASVLLTAITQFAFLAALSSAEFVLNYMKPLSVLLQKSGLDLCAASREVTIVQETLNDVRLSSDERLRRCLCEHCSSRQCSRN